MFVIGGFVGWLVTTAVLIAIGGVIALIVIVRLLREEPLDVPPPPSRPWLDNDGG